MATLGRGRTRTGAQAIGVLLALSPVGLAACGDDEGPAGSREGSLEVSGDYCIDIEAVRGLTAAAEPSDPSQFAADLDSARRVADEAPEEVAADWETVVGAMDRYQSVLSEAGVSPDDLAGGSPGLDLGDAELRALSSDIGEIFTDPELATAGESIAAHAKESCDVDLDVEAAGDNEPFCAELENVDLLGVETSTKAAAEVARQAGELASGAPVKVKDDLRTVADDYRKLSRIENDTARALAYIDTDISDATYRVVQWTSDHC